MAGSEPITPTKVEGEEDRDREGIDIDLSNSLGLTDPKNSCISINCAHIKGFVSFLELTRVTVHEVVLVLVAVRGTHPLPTHPLSRQKF